MTIMLPHLSIGNFASVLRMVQKVGGTAQLVDDPARLRSADKIILAGVGAFDNGMTSLREAGWMEPLNEAALIRKIPVLGICLGMQLMCKESEEGQLPGLGWIDAEVRRLELPRGSAFKIPHMGWAAVRATRANPLIESSQEGERFYFVHSYHATCNRPEDIIAEAQYGLNFTAAVSHKNIYGVQFHPEKSHRFGMAMMKRFVEL